MSDFYYKWLHLKLNSKFTHIHDDVPYRLPPSGIYFETARLIDGWQELEDFYWQIVTMDTPDKFNR